ncbi:MAG: porin family protein [Cyanobacteria bacterium]|nr:porin family protein [Cyanobacteriota bacterium]MDW8201872.1 outer membrane beta-barrel protein [Cyanobacteriota bacterium SKYGB_h_bin112]
MNKYFQSIATISVLSVAAAMSIVSASAVSAQEVSTSAKGLQGSYVGAGISAGVTSGGQGNDGAAFGGNVQGRYAFSEAPVSLRGAVLFTDKSVALMPIVTYDLPVAPKTNLYAGGGYSFVTNQNAATPLGNQNAVVLTAGVESEIARNVVAYGDVKYGINAFKGSNASAASIQVGVGYRF